MADDIDRATEHAERDLALRIGDVVNRPRLPGLPECLECGESISRVRQDLGARLCIDCQSDLELRNRR